MYHYPFELLLPILLVLSCTIFQILFFYWFITSYILHSIDTNVNVFKYIRILVFHLSVYLFILTPFYNICILSSHLKSKMEHL